MRRKTTRSRVRFLPHEAVVNIRKRLRQLLGGTLGFGALILFFILFSYNPGDSSLNTAGAGDIKNYLDYPGAVIADLLLQGFGLGSILFPLVAVVWGGFLFLELPFRRVGWRLVSMAFCLMFLSGFFALFPAGLGYLVNPSLGGSMGDLWLRFFSKFTLITNFFVLGIIFGLSSFVFLTLTLGLTIHQWGSVLNFIRHFGEHFTNALHWILTPTLELLRRKHKHQEVHEDFEDEPQLKPQRPAPVRLEIREEDVDQHRQITTHSIPINTSVYGNNDDDEDEAYDDFESPVTSRKAASKEQSEFQNFNYAQTSLEDYELPSIDLLDKTIRKNVKGVSPEALQQSAHQLEQVLQEFGIRGEIVGVCPGPVVTLYELKPAAGIKTSRVIGLADDIARSMSAHAARIAVIPGRNVIGVELPNPARETVYMRELLQTEEYQKHPAQLAMILGKDIGGNPIIADLARMPHLLVAGTTGSGKSVSINTMILSLLFRLSPDQCKFIMIDPKMLELSVYDGIPHLLTPVVTDPKKAVVALKWAVKEMENRYRAMSKLGVRNIDGYNARIQEALSTGELLMRRVQTGFDPDTGKPIFENQSLDVTPLPYIVVVVDEMADLMLVAGKEIEGAVQRLAQMARAAGIHLIMATQRPSVDVITGTIKANFPTRISFMVTSKIDSRTILGEQGAEQLLGQGDMLYMAGGGRLMRVHGPFLKDDEVERIVQFLKLQAEPVYVESITEDDAETGMGGDEGDGRDADPLYQQAVEIIRREGKASTSFIQRHLQIGYNRAARMIDLMERDGIISPANHVGKREVIG